MKRKCHSTCYWEDSRIKTIGMAKQPPTPDDSRRLIEENQGLVYHLVGQIHRRLPVRYEFDDLVGYGMVGLAEAAHGYVPSKGSKFSTFAFFRIRGAIYDGISESSWLTRAQYRQHVRAVAQASKSESEADSNFDDDSNRGDDSDWKQPAPDFVELTPEHAAQIVQSDNDTIASRLSQQEIIGELYLAVDALPRREEMLIKMVYFEGLSLKDAALRLGISKSWASRLHASILQQLGADMGRDRIQINPKLKDPVD